MKTNLHCDRAVCSRRRFRRSTAVMATVGLVPRAVWGGAGKVPSSDRLNVAIVGTGGQRVTNLKQLL